MGAYRGYNNNNNYIIIYYVDTPKAGQFFLVLLLHFLIILTRKNLKKDLNFTSYEQLKNLSPILGF